MSLALPCCRTYTKSMKRLLPTLLLSLVALPAYAQQDVGSKELSAIVGLFGSPLGLAVGLAVTAWGVFQFIVSQNVKRGIILIILGVVITGFPTLFNGIRHNFYSVPQDISGGQASGNANDFNQYVP